MRRLHCSIIRVGGAFGLLILLTSLISCGVSPDNAGRLNTATQAVAIQLQQGDVDAVYNNAGEAFRHLKSLRDWRSWNDSVRERWGPLRHVQIVHINRTAPFRGFYTVDTEMEYERGKTSGRFLFNLEQQKPTLLSALLITPTDQPTGGG